MLRDYLRNETAPGAPLFQAVALHKRFYSVRFPFFRGFTPTSSPCRYVQVLDKVATFLRMYIPRIENAIVIFSFRPQIRLGPVPTPLTMFTRRPRAHFPFRNGSLSPTSPCPAVSSMTLYTTPPAQEFPSFFPLIISTSPVRESTGLPYHAQTKADMNRMGLRNRKSLTLLPPHPLPSLLPTPRSCGGPLPILFIRFPHRPALQPHFRPEELEADIQDPRESPFLFLYPG